MDVFLKLMKRLDQKKGPELSGRGDLDPYPQCRGTGSGNRDPELFWPLSPGSGSGSEIEKNRIRDKHHGSYFRYHIWVLKFFVNFSVAVSDPEAGAFLPWIRDEKEKNNNIQNVTKIKYDFTKIVQVRYGAFLSLGIRVQGFFKIEDTDLDLH